MHNRQFAPSRSPSASAQDAALRVAPCISASPSERVLAISRGGTTAPPDRCAKGSSRAGKRGAPSRVASRCASRVCISMARSASTSRAPRASSRTRKVESGPGRLPERVVVDQRLAVRRRPVAERPLVRDRRPEPRGSRTSKRERPSRMWCQAPAGLSHATASRDRRAPSVVTTRRRQRPASRRIRRGGRPALRPARSPPAGAAPLRGAGSTSCCGGGGSSGGPAGGDRASGSAPGLAPSDRSGSDTRSPGSPSRGS